MKNILQLINGIGIKELSPKLWEAFVAIDRTLDDLLGKINALTTPKTLYCRARNIADQVCPTLPAGINVAFDVTNQNSNFHDNVNNNTHFYISEEGWYNVGFSIRWEPNATGIRYTQLVLTRDGTGRVIAMDSDAPRDVTQLTMNVASTGIYLYPRDTLHLLVRQDSGGNLNVLANAAPNDYIPVFWLQKNV